MEKLSHNLNLDLSAKRRMFDEIISISKCNPGVISTIYEKAQKPEYLIDNRLNLGLIMIDTKMEKLYSGK